jgi:hypothetical protein
VAACRISIARVLLAALLVAGWSPGADPAHAQDEYGYADEGAPDLETLAPYGTWQDDPRYGHVWQPAVGIGWAPYVDGYWTWTPYGWTWVSSEPWSWTFHYGRWVLTVTGWVWVPGSVWGPAWVDWYWADGYIGWAPLGPFARHVAVLDNFVFVHERDFCSRGLSHLAVNHHLVPDHVVHGWQHRDWRRDRAPDVGRIERVSRFPVQRYERRPPGTVRPGGGRTAGVDRRFYRAPEMRRPYGGDAVPRREWQARQAPAQRLGRARPNPFAGNDGATFERRRARTAFDGGGRWRSNQRMIRPGQGASRRSHPTRLVCAGARLCRKRARAAALRPRSADGAEPRSPRPSPRLYAAPRGSPAGPAAAGGRIRRTRLGRRRVRRWALRRWRCSAARVAFMDHRARRRQPSPGTLAGRRRRPARGARRRGRHGGGPMVTSLATCGAAARRAGTVRAGAPPARRRAGDERRATDLSVAELCDAAQPPRERARGRGRPPRRHPRARPARRAPRRRRATRRRPSAALAADAGRSRGCRLR